MNFVALFYMPVCLIILFSSCEKDAQAPLQNTGKLVVHAYISPQQSTICVTVSLSRGYYNSVIDKNEAHVESIRDALVVISDGSISKTILWNAQCMDYELDATEFQISAGKMYQLNVSAPGRVSVFAQTSIPEPIKDPTFKFVGIDKRGGDDLYTYEFSISNDFSKGNYYRFYPQLEGYVEGSMTQVTPVYGYQYFKESGNPVGTEMMYLLSKPFSNSNMKLRHTGYFISCSKEYYFYHRALVRINDQNIEKENLYSNIKGGYGVFAGYNQTALIVSSVYSN